MMRVVLASASPRRSDLLKTLGVPFLALPADIDESELPGEDPVAYVHRLAVAKAEAAGALDAVRPDDIVIAADTTVDVDGQILAKPRDVDDARRMLGLLSGREHTVHTGVAVRRDAHVRSEVATTVVTMVDIDDIRMHWYLGTGEPFGKAGAYAIQGAGSLLVERIDGSVSNVIGLPLAVLDRLLGHVGTSLAVLATPGAG
jgi:septum formation protein